MDSIGYGFDVAAWISKASPTWPAFKQRGDVVNIAGELYTALT